MARNAKVIIMTDESIKERLQVYAEKMGMTVSGLGSFILGHWVYQQDEMLKPFIDGARDHLMKIIEKELPND